MNNMSARASRDIVAIAAVSTDHVRRVPGRGLEPLHAAPKTAVLPIRRPRIGWCYAACSAPMWPQRYRHHRRSSRLAVTEAVMATRSSASRMEVDEPAVTSSPLWVRWSRSAASACARRSTRRCCVGRGTSVANSALIGLRWCEPPGCARPRRPSRRGRRRARRAQTMWRHCRRDEGVGHMPR